MKNLVNVLKAKEGFICRTPANDKEIRDAEIALELSFSEDYKDYLKAYGSASYNGHELTGIHTDKRIDVVQSTKFMRQFYPQLTGNYYLIEDTNLDGLIVCQSSNGIIYIFSPNGSMRRIANSLLDYIESD